MTNVILFMMMIGMACIGYASAYIVLQREITRRDIELNMAYTYIGDKLHERARKKRV